MVISNLVFVAGVSVYHYPLQSAKRPGLTIRDRVATRLPLTMPHVERLPRCFVAFNGPIGTVSALLFTPSLQRHFNASQAYSLIVSKAEFLQSAK